MKSQLCYFYLYHLAFKGDEKAEPISSAQEEHLDCPPKGVIDLGPCKFGAPLYVSWPSFYLADKKLLDAVDGIPEPNEKDHGFRMDIQPTMGLGVSVQVRMQMNLKIESSPILSIPNFVEEPFLLPIMWFEDSIEKIPHDIHDMLKEALTSGPGLALKIFISFMFLVVFEIILLAAFFFWKFTKSKRSRSAQDTHWWKNLINDICILRTERF